ncbi:MAG TPA: hypothetical protein VGF40_04645 [Thermoanaerobaculia bacterium]
MEPETPAHLDARGFIERFERGDFPRDFVVLAARGFLPLETAELATIVIHLTGAPDEEIAAAARDHLAEIPPRVLADYARNPDLDPETLGRLARAHEDEMVLEAILRNRATTDEAVRELAAHATGHLQEVIIINHERLLRMPEIIDALAANPQLVPDVRRRITEVQEEFFQKKRIEDVKIEEGWADLSLTAEEEEQFKDLLAAAEAASAEDDANTLRDAQPVADDAEAASVWNRIQKMTISERVRCAIKGGRTERGILIKDRNKLVCAAAIRSPRITESEVETFAGMRNLEDEVLRIIGSNRAWMQKYPLMSALVRNPKAPIGVVLPLINRLTLKDLRTLSSDKGVSEAVRQSARKLYATRKKT